MLALALVGGTAAGYTAGTTENEPRPLEAVPEPASAPAPAADPESLGAPTPATTTGEENQTTGDESQPRPTATGVPVYLTFDDGPDPTFTPKVLDLLAAHGATATFFVQGSQVAAYPDLARRIAAAGHSVQNHAWDHPRLTELGTDQVINSQLLPTNQVIASATGTTPTCLRAPFGATDPTVNSAAATAGLDVVGWDVNPADYDDPGAAQIAAGVLSSLAPGSVVLLHDGGSGDRQQTVDALATLLPEMATRGFAPQALCQ